jgi:hypothetical protein
LHASDAFVVCWCPALDYLEEMYDTYLVSAVWCVSLNAICVICMISVPLSRLESSCNPQWWMPPICMYFLRRLCEICENLNVSRQHLRFHKSQKISNNLIYIYLNKSSFGYENEVLYI